MTDSEQEQPEVEPEADAVPLEPTEGETYMEAYQRQMREAGGIADSGEVLGVLTGQVPVRSMPIALEAPEGIKGENLPKQPLDGDMLDEPSD